ncbi:MAG: DUF1080 domain-containing protein [Anaerolineales bacterium]|nr:DUF1080 domain-containing protein [Anaerolineales bacterium]
MQKYNFPASSQAGQALLEYSLLVVLILLVLGGLQLYGITLHEAYCSMDSLLGIVPENCISAVAWQDNLDSLDRWNITSGGGWIIEDGKLKITKNGEHRAFTGEEEWEDYTIQVDGAVLEAGKGYGIYFRITDEPNIDGYAFQYDPGYNNEFIIREIVDGRELGVPIARAKAPDGFDWYGTPHAITIQVQGDTFTAFVDGESVVTAVDDTSTNGRIGLRGWTTTATFDQLLVTQP